MVIVYISIIYRSNIEQRSWDSGWHQDGWQPNEIPFTATPRPRNSVAELDSDLPAELLQHIVNQTNLYASKYFQAHPDSLPYSRGKVWKPVSVTELKTFFGISFLTGYVKKPNRELFWSVDEVDATPYFSKTMSRNRFHIIWRFLHYNNNASQDVTDKMFKVCPVLDYIMEKFKDHAKLMRRFPFYGNFFLLRLLDPQVIFVFGVVRST